MIITSTQQFKERSNPSTVINLEEFEEITLKFGSFICIASQKKINFLNFLKILVENKKMQKLYFDLLNEDNLHYIVSSYLRAAPNVYKKIFRSKLNKKK
jgi:hypothetical protein